MFSKILIANRGEIACRVIRTARAMGIRTVAVHSDADARALHVRMADEAIRIGPPPAAESYIHIERVMDAVRASGAEAVHPGYGFLSENPRFAEALAAEGVAFVGPPAGAIEKMGDKITSKKIAAEAGVSTVPGHMGLIEDAEEAVRIAREIGYPVMLKASAGGGGKGMRIAWTDEEAREGFRASKVEAKASFGDDRMFVEKFVTQPRHIEIQVLADGHGNALHLGERECSIQRRNQKVIEEAPSPFLDAATRRAMGEQAVALARAVGYESAGTVEFIAGADRDFYFLEMNTRLQVEHPVTELVTGIDLVREMIRVAAGEPLLMTQADVRLTGWAIESRVYAEDPYRGFLPSTGRLSRYRPPEEVGAGPLHGTEEGAAVRNDTGVSEGGEISMFYDPMIAKLVTWAPTREEAADLQVEALDAFRIEGPGHNVDFLSALMQHPRFRAGELTTGFIAEEYPDGFDGAAASATMRRMVAAWIAGAEFTERARAGRISQRLNPAPHPGSDWSVRLDGQTYAVAFADEVDGAYVDGELVEGTWDWEAGRRSATVTAQGETYRIQLRRDGAWWTLTTRGRRYRGMALPARHAQLAGHMIEKTPPDTSKMLLSPMPGLLVSLHVGEGDEVEAGQPLATIEAMKMENILRAARKGTVSSIKAAEGESLAVDAVIMEFE